MTLTDIIYEEAENLVSKGVFDSIDDAWEEAHAICLDSDAFEKLLDDDDDEHEDFE